MNQRGFLIYSTFQVWDYFTAVKIRENKHIKAHWIQIYKSVLWGKNIYHERSKLF